MKVLYICTHNRCRSILCEAITNHLTSGLIEAKSAGSQPVNAVHPSTLKHLRLAGIPAENLKSKSWDELADFSPDIVITVCDSAAGESCPVYFSKSIRVHWGLGDPTAINGSEKEKHEAFIECINTITSRTRKLLELAKSNPDKEALLSELEKIGARP